MRKNENAEGFCTALPCKNPRHFHTNSVARFHVSDSDIERIWIVSTTSSRRCFLRAVNTRFAPSLANASADALPIPELAPVMIQTDPANFLLICVFLAPFCLVDGLKDHPRKHINLISFPISG